MLRPSFPTTNPIAANGAGTGCTFRRELGTIQGTGAHFYHFDETGSTAALTDESGAATDTYAVAPYGESVTHSGPTDNPFSYQGRLGVMREGTTGLYYMRARYYDSGSARFLSRDPASGADARSMNPYQFAYGNPEGLADPSGLRLVLRRKVQFVYMSRQMLRNIAFDTPGLGSSAIFLCRPKATIIQVQNISDLKGDGNSPSHSQSLLPNPDILILDNHRTRGGSVPTKGTRRARPSLPGLW